MALIDSTRSAKIYRQSKLDGIKNYIIETYSTSNLIARTS